jgi:hypothetical protein
VQSEATLGPRSRRGQTGLPTCRRRAAPAVTASVRDQRRRRPFLGTPARRRVAKTIGVLRRAAPPEVPAILQLAERPANPNRAWAHHPRRDGVRPPRPAQQANARADLGTFGAPSGSEHLHLRRLRAELAELSAQRSSREVGGPRAGESRGGLVGSPSFGSFETPDRRPEILKNVFSALDRRRETTPSGLRTLDRRRRTLPNGSFGPRSRFPDVFEAFAKRKSASRDVCAAFARRRSPCPEVCAAIERRATACRDACAAIERRATACRDACAAIERRARLHPRAARVAAVGVEAVGLLPSAAPRGQVRRASRGRAPSHAGFARMRAAAVPSNASPHHLRPSNSETQGSHSARACSLSASPESLVLLGLRFCFGATLFGTRNRPSVSRPGGRQLRRAQPILAADCIAHNAQLPGSFGESARVSESGCAFIERAHRQSTRRCSRRRPCRCSRRGRLSCS